MKPSDMIATLEMIGWSRRGIAQYVGVGTPTISRMATDQCANPRYKTMDALRELIASPTPINRARGEQ
jgi:transcriptional regulator with XRE-family HTH domain